MKWRLSARMRNAPPCLRLWLETAGDLLQKLRSRVFLFGILPLLVLTGVCWTVFVHFGVPRPDRLPDPRAAQMDPREPQYAVVARMTERVQSATSSLTNLGPEERRKFYRDFPVYPKRPLEGGHAWSVARVTRGERGIYRDTGIALLSPGSSWWSFPLSIPGGGRLMCQPGVFFTSGLDQTMTFLVHVRDGRHIETVAELTLNTHGGRTPDRMDKLRLWFRPDLPETGLHSAFLRVDLQKYAGKTIRLVLETKSPDGDALAFWINPMLAAGVARTHPHVLMIVLGGGPSDWMGRTASGQPWMPRLSRLAGQGRYGRRLVLSTPAPLGNTFALMTGRCPQEADFAGRPQDLCDGMIRRFHRRGYSTLPVRFAESGYATCAIVSHADWMSGRGAVDFGFDRSVNMQRAAYDTRDVLLAATRWLKQHEGLSSFVYLRLQIDGEDAHPPKAFLQQGKQMTSDKDKQRLFAQMRYVDDEVGRWIQWLRTQGMPGRTIILLTSDRVTSMQEGRGKRHGTEVVHAPCLILMHEEAGRKPWTTGVRSIKDLGVTALELAGVKIAGFPGVSLLRQQGHGGPVFYSAAEHTVMVTDGWVYTHRTPLFFRNAADGRDGRHDFVDAGVPIRTARDLFYDTRPQSSPVSVVRIQGGGQDIVQGIIRSESPIREIQYDWSPLRDRECVELGDARSIRFAVFPGMRPKEISFELTDSQVFWLEDLRQGGEPCPETSVLVGPYALPLAFRKDTAGRIEHCPEDLESTFVPAPMTDPHFPVHVYRISYLNRMRRRVDEQHDNRH